MNDLPPCCLLAILWSWLSFAEGITVLPPRQLTEGTAAKLRVSAPGHAGKTLVWRVGVRDTVLAGGGLRVGADGVAELILETPTLRTREALPLVLWISGPTPEAEAVETKLWVFPKDPLWELKLRLRERPLRLYDPPGRTARWLRALELPYERVDRPEDAADGTLLVGEAVSFADRPDLAGRLRQVASAGVKVLCLRPKDGHADVPEADAERAASVWSLAGEAFFVDRNPRLEGSGLGFQYVQPISRKDGVALDLRAATGWSWSEFRYPGGGVLAFSGAKLMESAGDSPASALWLETMLDFFDTHNPDRGKTP